MSRSLAYRRHQRFRYRRKAKGIVAQWRIEQADTRERLVRLIEKNRRKCSCLLCQRSRRVMGPSPQEQRQPQWTFSPSTFTYSHSTPYGSVWPLTR